MRAGSATLAAYPRSNTSAPINVASVDAISNQIKIEMLIANSLRDSTSRRAVSVPGHGLKIPGRGSGETSDSTLLLHTAQYLPGMRKG